MSSEADHSDISKIGHKGLSLNEKVCVCIRRKKHSLYNVWDDLQFQALTAVLENVCPRVRGAVVLIAQCLCYPDQALYKRDRPD